MVGLCGRLQWLTGLYILTSNFNPESPEFGWSKSRNFWIRKWVEINSLTTEHRRISAMQLLLIIRLEARLQLNIGFTFDRALAVFTRSDITPPKMNRFG